MAKPSALGKGLSALISSRPAATPVASPTPVEEKGERVQPLAVGSLTPSPLQPRKNFREEELIELADSIREHGILQPLICRQAGDRFELIAGERRWRAAQRLGLESVPVIVREASDRDVLELALIENLQRAELNPVEEAKAYLRLAEEFAMKQEDISRRVGRSRASVANAMRLLDLAPQLQTWLSQERLTVGHAKVLLALRSQEEQLAAAEEILRKGLTVRGSETLVSQLLEFAGKTRKAKNSKTSQGVTQALQSVQNRLQHHFGTHVALHHGDKRGRIEIEYYGNDDLNRLLSLLGIQEDNA
jgi:ParB family transcriptional regulator, chromosome partitioning protein